MGLSEVGAIGPASIPLDMERIQALRLFVRVVDLGSFSEAAGEIGIGQPAATKQVARLEQRLGARLLHRPAGHQPAGDRGLAGLSGRAQGTDAT